MLQMRHIVLTVVGCSRIEKVISRYGRKRQYLEYVVHRDSVPRFSYKLPVSAHYVSGLSMDNVS